MMKLENLIGMNARAALIELQANVGKVVKSTRMLKLGRWSNEWKTENGQTYVRKVRYFETAVTGADREWCWDNCTVTGVTEREDDIRLDLETPKGNERMVSVRFYKNRPYVAPQTEEEVENAETEEEVEEPKVEQKKVEKKTTNKEADTDEQLLKLLNRPENAYYLEFARTMKKNGELQDWRAVKAACRMFDRPSLFYMALKVVAAE